eukprot:gene9452-1698_t
MHGRPVDAICSDDGELLCSQCYLEPGAAHQGHVCNAAEKATSMLESQLGELLAGLLEQCQQMVASNLDWRGQVAAAEFVGETHCALMQANAGKGQRLAALASLSRSSAQAVALTGKASRALADPTVANLLPRIALPAALRWFEDAAAPVTVYMAAVGQSGLHKTIAAGRLGCVAIRPGGSLVSWGADAFVSHTPAGAGFASVSAGYAHAVALRVDGSLACWRRGCDALPVDGAGQGVAASGRLGAGARPITCGDLATNENDTYQLSYEGSWSY